MIPVPERPASARKPRLAYVFSRYPVISQTFVDNEILGLEAAGWDVVVCAIHPPRDMTMRHPRLSQLRAPVIYAPPPEVRKGHERWLKSQGEWPEAFLARHAETFGEKTRPDQTWQNASYFADQLKALGVDHVHVHFANRATHAALMLKRLAGIPFSFTPQAQDFMIDIESPEVLADMCEAAEFVIVACDWARDELIKLCPRTGDKVFRIYNGIDPTPYPTAKPAPPNAMLRIVSVGRLIEFKGFHHLIAAIGIARDQGVTVHLDLMGDGPWREQLQQQVAALKLESQVTFHGSVTIDAMRACYARVDAFALACIEDSKGAMDVFPTVITEAMLSSLPVVSCRIAGVPEQVIDGVTGFVTDPRDEAALAVALQRLATEPGLAARMGEAGRAHAMKHFAIDATLPMLEAHFMQRAAKAERAPAARIGTFYDLSAECHTWLLPTEAPVLHELHCQTWIAAEGVDHKLAMALEPTTKDAFWLPVEGVLEMEWRARPEEHERINAMRAQLSPRLTDEEFHRAARIALWIAVQSKRLGLPAKWYVPTEKEINVMWIVHELTQVPVMLSQMVFLSWPSGEACEVLPKRSRSLTSRPRRGVARVMPWLRPWQTRRWQTSLRMALAKV